MFAAESCVVVDCDAVVDEHMQFSPHRQQPLIRFVATVILFLNPFKPSGVKWLHFKVFSAILHDLIHRFYLIF